MSNITKLSNFIDNTPYYKAADYTLKRLEAFVNTEKFNEEQFALSQELQGVLSFGICRRIKILILSLCSGQESVAREVAQFVKLYLNEVTLQHYKDFMDRRKENIFLYLHPEGRPLAIEILNKGDEQEVIDKVMKCIRKYQNPEPQTIQGTRTQLPQLGQAWINMTPEDLKSASQKVPIVLKGGQVTLDLEFIGRDNTAQ